MSADRTTRTAEPGTAPRTALLLVDLQEAFFEAPGLAVTRADVLAAVGALADGAREAGAPILLVTIRLRRPRSRPVRSARAERSRQRPP